MLHLLGDHHPATGAQLSLYKKFGYVLLDFLNEAVKFIPAAMTEYMHN